MLQKERLLEMKKHWDKYYEHFNDVKNAIDTAIALYEKIERKDKMINKLLNRITLNMNNFTRELYGEDKSDLFSNL